VLDIVPPVPFVYVLPEEKHNFLQLHTTHTTQFIAQTTMVTMTIKHATDRRNLTAGDLKQIVTMAVAVN